MREVSVFTTTLQDGFNNGSTYKGKHIRKDCNQWVRTTGDTSPLHICQYKEKLINFTDNGLDKTRVCPPSYLNRLKSNVFPSTVPSQQNKRGERLLEGETRPPQWCDSEKRVNVSSWYLWDIAMFSIAQVAKLIYTCLPSATMVYRLNSAFRYSQVYL